MRPPPTESRGGEKGGAEQQEGGEGRSPAAWLAARVHSAQVTSEAAPSQRPESSAGGGSLCPRHCWEGSRDSAGGKAPSPHCSSFLCSQLRQIPHPNPLQGDNCLGPGNPTWARQGHYPELWSHLDLHLESGAESSSEGEGVSAGGPRAAGWPVRAGPGLRRILTRFHR